MKDKARGLFDQQLAKLREDIVHLGEMVQNATERSIQALKERNQDMAHQVLTGDELINTKRYEIEEQSLTLIATQQPAASDLRAIIAAIHIAEELERMGDHATGIAELAIRLADQPHLKPLIDIPHMAEIARAMIHDSLEAYLKQDPDLALRTAQRDAEIDGVYDQLYRELLTYMLEDPKTIAQATYLLWVSHNLERIADRAVNVCERVIFMTTGEFKELSF